MLSNQRVRSEPQKYEPSSRAEDVSDPDALHRLVIYTSVYAHTALQTRFDQNRWKEIWNTSYFKCRGDTGTLRHESPEKRPVIYDLFKGIGFPLSPALFISLKPFDSSQPIDPPATKSILIILLKFLEQFTAMQLLTLITTFTLGLSSVLALPGPGRHYTGEQADESTIAISVNKHDKNGYSALFKGPASCWGAPCLSDEDGKKEGDGCLCDLWVSGPLVSFHIFCYK